MDFEDLYDYAVSHEEYFDKKLNLWNEMWCAVIFSKVCILKLS